MGALISLKGRKRHYHDVYIAHGRLGIRDVAIRARPQHVPLDEIVDMEVAQSPRGLHLAIRCRDHHSIPLLEGSGHSTEELTWLRDHLRAGIAAAREGRALPAAEEA